MRNLETSGMFAQAAEQIKGIPRILMGKKLMTSDDNEEFIAMVISLAERKSMTISNIKDAIQEIIEYLEDNATLTASLNEELVQETGCSIEKIANALSEAANAQISEIDAGTPSTHSKTPEEVSESARKDAALDEKIYDMILNFYSRDGVSVYEVSEILGKVQKMFEHTSMLLGDNIQQDS